jgi:hypothetical protein
MTHQLFGAKSNLLSYSDLATALTATPDFTTAGPRPALRHYDDQLSRLRGLAEVAEAVAVDAEAVAVPPMAATLQELVQAGRARLYRERSRQEQETIRGAVDHLSRLRDLLQP